MPAVTSNQLREMYVAFFESKGHVRIPSAPLVPENDPSVLFTTAGMHPLVPYLKGQPHPAGNRLVDAQKCLRTTDIEEVGDASHATVFEMLGNWSLGDYFKEDAITWSWEFLTSSDWLNLDPNRLAVSVFAGDADAPRDAEAAALWTKVGVPDERLAYLDKQENWWPAGGKHPGPQGPDTEMFYWIGASPPPARFDPSDSSWVEIWNNVFMQYNRTESGEYEELPQQNVDTGMGLERTIVALNGLSSIYEIDTYAPLMRLLDDAIQQPDERQRRILADHLKAATFVLGDDHPIEPSNKDQGYVLRRLIRRAMMAARELRITQPVGEFLAAGAETVISSYQDAYPSLVEHRAHIQGELTKEAEKFLLGLQKIDHILQNRSDINGQQAFELFSTYGFPLEVQIAEAAKRGIPIDTKGFDEAMADHQEKSRTAAAGKFKGGLADHSEQSVKYHTATHLLHQALRTVLGDHVLQKGSNITPERLRFDFSHPDKLTTEQRQAVEDLVNQKISEDLPVTREEMTVAEAKKRGALGLFEQKYGDKVSVYSMGDFSCEICGGPHVEHTGTLGHFKIIKEESASAGIRRIKATLK